MLELQAITTGLTTLKSALEIVNTLKSIDKSYSEAEFKTKIIELTENLVDLKSKLLEIKEENISYKVEIKNLKDKLNLCRTVFFENNVYWIKSDKDTDGPFCQVCFDDKEKLIRLQEDNWIDVDGVESKNWRCHVCKNIYNR